VLQLIAAFVYNGPELLGLEATRKSKQKSMVQHLAWLGLMQECDMSPTKSHE